MRTYFGILTETGLRATKEYECWMEYISHVEGTEVDGHKVVHLTRLFEAKHYCDAVVETKRQCDNYLRKVQEAIDLDYWVEGVRGADI